MKISLNWLNEFVKLPTQDVADLRRSLAMAGHEVEGVETVEAGWTDVFIARVESVDSHPNADKVRVCTVTMGGDPITVVCGAWNFEAGAKVAFAVPGAVLPGDFKIGTRTIRGVESHGMICSESELGLGEEHDGILVLEDDAPIGEPFESILDLPDVVFDLSITPNRPDAMSVYGIARDLAAWYKVDLKPLQIDPPTVPGNPEVSVSIEDAEANPRFVARQIDGVTVAPSPLAIRQRLRRSGVRPISNLVDITNYVMIELGQPLHVFDLDRIEGGQLSVRRAEEGEVLVTLDDVSRSLGSDDLVIYDSSGPTSLAGTMGGARSEVSDETKRVLIEAAHWDPPTIMYMSRRHGLRSEASARFERGVDPNLPLLASLRAGEMMLELGGGELRDEPIDEIAQPFEPVTLALRVEDVTRLLGDEFDANRISESLNRLGFGVEGDDPMSVAVPSYRPDVTRPVDLVEEVARMADLDTFPEVVRSGAGGGLTFAQLRERQLRRELVALGFYQAVSLSFVMPAELEAFNPPDDSDLLRTIVVKNPLSEEEAVLRTTLLPGLLRVVRHNRNRGSRNVATFEQGRVFHNRSWGVDRRVPDQPQRVAFVAAGHFGPVDLAGDGRPVDAHTMTGLVTHLAASLGVPLVLEQASEPGWHPTRTARMVISGQTVGHVGELHPLTVAAFDLDGRVGAVEFDLEAFIGAHSEPQYQAPSPYPPTDFDLSFEVDGSVTAGDLVEAVRAGGGPLVESVRVFDEFVGGQLGEGKKALALRTRLRAPDRTLQSEEIAASRTAMVDAAADLGAVLRGSV